MGNQGYSTEAIRVGCETVWAGEIGDVTEVRAWHGGPGLPQEMQKIPAPTPVPDTLDWDLRLGAGRPGPARRVAAALAGSDSTAGCSAIGASTS